MGMDEILETETSTTDETIVQDEVVSPDEVISPDETVVDSGDDSSISVSPDTVYIDTNNVMLVNDVESYAVGDNSGYQLPEYYVNYFRGVLDNKGNTEYLAFAYRDYNTSSGYNTYTEHYIFIYDIDVVNDEAVNGNYPCIDIYRQSGNNAYTYSTYDYYLSTYPSFSYGSFGNLSSLREGVSYEQGNTLLLGLAIAFVCALLESLFHSSKR